MALVLVTGARGAIGQHVVGRARARGHRVIGLGHGSWTGGAGMTDGDLPAIDAWINGGVDPDNLGELARREGPPDAIVHLAGGALVGPSIAHPGEDFRRTVESGQRLLEWVRTEAPKARLVLASSAAVYGDGHAGPIPEAAAFAPTSPYGTHKAMMEMLARSYARQFGLAVAVVRLFSVYGPGLRKQLIWDLGGRLARGERRVTLGGSGEERRDFVHIADAADMLLNAIAVADSATPTFNGCTGRGARVAEIAALITAQVPGATYAFSGESRAGDPHALVGDATLARAAGLTGGTSIESGIPETVAWILTALDRGGRR